MANGRVGRVTIMLRAVIDLSGVSGMSISCYEEVSDKLAYGVAIQGSYEGTPTLECSVYHPTYVMARMRRMIGI